MENFFSRYKNPLVLMAVLFIQVIALATQVRRPENARGAGSGGTRLIRVWTVTAVTPFEQALVATGHFVRDTWHNYIDLHDVRRQNRELQEELARMRLEQVRLKTDAEQTRRLKALLDFKERYVGKTVAAQVIGSSGTDLTHMIYIDKGSHAGIKQDMAVITPDGIVGKVKDVFPFSSQVLMINDHESAAGVILENSRLNGVLHGTGLGVLRVGAIMSDENVEVGERVVTSGGDGIYPEGLPVGTVTSVGTDTETGPFLGISVKPAADLNRLEEVLVVTSIVEEAPNVFGPVQPSLGANVLAQRPSIPKTEGDSAKNKVGTAAVPVAGAGAPTKKQIAPGPTPNSLAPITDQKAAAAPEKKRVTPQNTGATPDKKTPETSPPAKPKSTPPSGGAEKPPQ